MPLLEDGKVVWRSHRSAVFEYCHDGEIRRAGSINKISSRCNSTGLGYSTSSSSVGMASQVFLIEIFELMPSGEAAMEEAICLHLHAP